MMDIDRPFYRTRAGVVGIARAELGLSDASKYWRDVLTSGPPFPPSWCGAFALFCLRQAGLTEWHWEIGKGFLWRLKRTYDPQIGDCGYLDQPFQHHFVVTEVGTHTLTSVDGNQGVPGVQERHRALPNPHLVFYSIDPLLRSDTEPAPPSAHPTLKLGSTGPDVAELQRVLNAHAGMQLAVDGQFGRLTALAVQSLQRRAGLDADGVVGPKTWQVLEHLT